MANNDAMDRFLNEHEGVPVSSGEDEATGISAPAEGERGILSEDEREELKRARNATVLECPACGDHRATVIASVPPAARCVGCAHVYPIQAEAPQPAKGKTTMGSGDNEREVEYTVGQQMRDEDLGTTSDGIGQIIKGGPEALIKAQRLAARLAKKLGEEVEASWLLDTRWLKALKDRNARAHRATLRWRPLFLATYQLTASFIIAAKKAGTTYATVYWHRQQDPEFEAQCLKAEQLAAEVLHAACWKSAVEGDLEPVYHQGIKVGVIRKMDSRLRIEMLRAHMPNRFKTPANANVTIHNDNRSVLVMDEKTRDALIEKRRGALQRIKDAKTSVLVDTGTGYAMARPAVESP